jgi:hypothetical protein
LTEERRPVPDRQRDLDQQVEELARRLAGVVNGAGESRAALREYAIELLKEETELGDVPEPSSGAKTHATGTNPLGLALLLGLVALPLVVVFWPIGLTLLAMALILGVWGVVATLVRR